MDNTLSSYCELIIDCEHKTAPTQNEGYPSIRTPNIGRGNLILDNVNRVSEEVYKMWSRKTEPKAGDLIFAREAPVGNVAMIPPNLKVCLGQRTVLIRADKTKIEPKYLMYLLLGDEVQNRFHSQTSGATVAHLNLADIRKLVIPTLPNRNTQRRIAAILSAYDELIENNSRRIKILEEMARMIYQEWFVKFRFPGHEQTKFVESSLGMIPAGWEVGRLDDALVLQRGFDLPEKQRQKGIYPIFAATGIVGTHNEAKVKAPGIITGRSGSLGKVLYVDVDYWPLNTALWVKEFKHSTPLFAYFLLSTLHLEKYNSGVAVPTLNRNDVHGLPVLLPPKSLLNTFDSYVISIFELIKYIKNKNTNLRQTRDMLLPKLISGEIDVSDLDIPIEER